MKTRKLMIVVEETGVQSKLHEGKSKFIVYIAGDTERIGKVPDDDLSSAEFWGSRLFNICIHALREAGAIEKIIDPKAN